MENNRSRKIRDNTRKLCNACRIGNLEEVEDILINEEVDINGSDHTGFTPLIRAVRGQHVQIVRRLLEHPDLQLGKRQVDYHFVCALLYLGREVYQNNNESKLNETALHHACRVDIVKLLCKDRRFSPSLVNFKNRRGYTPLTQAVHMDNLDIVKELDREGTDFRTRDRDGRNLIEVARTRNNVEVLKYLVERGKKVDSLKVIAAYSVARYMENKPDVTALEIPKTLQHLVEGFVGNDRL